MRFLTSLFVLLGCLFAPPFATPVAAQIIDTNIPGRAPVPSQTDPENLLYLDLSTGGRVVVWLRPDVAPLMVERIKTLTRQHFYDGLLFHRVIDGFMAQTGDPKGDGTGGSPMPDVKAEFNYLPHVRGAVSAARSTEEDSANSQFFIVFEPRLSLDKKYTVFGRVLSGMEFADAVERGEPPTNPSRILHAYIAADSPPPFSSAPAAAGAATGNLGPAIDLPGDAPKPTAPAKKPVAGPQQPR